MHLQSFTKVYNHPARYHKDAYKACEAPTAPVASKTVVLGMNRHLNVSFLKTSCMFQTLVLEHQYISDCERCAVYPLWRNEDTIRSYMA